jgi:hypothetical protein
VKCAILSRYGLAIKKNDLNFGGAGSLLFHRLDDGTFVPVFGDFDVRREVPQAGSSRQKQVTLFDNEDSNGYAFIWSGAGRRNRD